MLQGKSKIKESFGIKEANKTRECFEGLQWLCGMNNRIRYLLGDSGLYAELKKFRNVLEWSKAGWCMPVIPSRERVHRRL